MKNVFNQLNRIFILVLLIVGINTPFFAQNNNVGIGTTSPHQSAVLELQSTTQGLLVPRREIGGADWTPAVNGEGMVRYDKNANQLQSWSGSWKPVGEWGINQGYLNYLGGNVGIGTDSPLYYTLTVQGTFQVYQANKNFFIPPWDGFSGMIISGVFDGLGNGAQLRFQGTPGGFIDIGNDASGNFVVNGNGVNRFFVGQDGNVGIGNANPTTGKLVITTTAGSTGLDLSSSDAYADMRVIRNSLHPTDNNMYIGYGAAATAKTYISGGGTNPTITVEGGRVCVGLEVLHPYKLLVNQSTGFGLGIRNPAVGLDWELYHAGGSGALEIYYGALRGSFDGSTGAYSALSDRRLKENIAPLDNVLSSLLKLEAKSYTFIADPKKERSLGFIAQEVEQLFPELITPPAVTEKGESPYLMDYSGFGILAVKAIQEQQEIIDTQAKKIETLETEMNAIKKALAKAGVELD